MISICIPIYNYDATTLVQDLHKQAVLLGVPFEFVLLDDVSDIKFRKLNKQLSSLENVVYRENNENIGLSRMRNRLASLAVHPYLIFIDSDAVVTKPDYLSEYLKACSPGVVCFGGCVYSSQKPSPEYILRWKFGKNREEGLGRYYSCFNFLVDAKVIKKYPFSEELKQYGYEDNLFAATLIHAGLKARFLDNPLLHPGLDSADGYLKKIDLSISNLLFIEPYLIEKEMADSVKLLRVFNSVKRMHLVWLVKFSFQIFRKVCEMNLKGNNPRLFVLDFYKLGLICTKYRKKQLSLYVQTAVSK